MRYIEELSWILDKIGVWADTLELQEKLYGENIAFVHSLGLKCDSVGWSELTRDDPRADEILDKIRGFCVENGWTARGMYRRSYEDFDTDWYELDGDYFRDPTVKESVEVPAQEGGTVELCRLHAYREITVAPKLWRSRVYVPERFLEAFREMNMTGLDFCWAKDTGKYAAHQYFTVYAGQRIPRVAVGWDLKKRDLRKLGPDGGWLPRLGQVFSKWTQLSLPECYLKEDMPAGGIAYAYIPSSWSCCGLYQILVHKDVAQRLLQAKAVPASALKPVPVLDDLPSDYTLRETSPYHRPTQEYMAQSLRDYEALKKKVRPTWVVTEKDALKLLRKAKKEGQLGKKLAKAKVEALAGTAYGPLLPYYLITGGGYLSDEYKLLTVPESQMETAEFYQALEKEELLAVKPEGLVICTCANGDKVLLLHDGTVIRFSHEAPGVCEQWQSLPQFIVDAINEC